MVVQSWVSSLNSNRLRMQTGASLTENQVSSIMIVLDAELRFMTSICSLCTGHNLGSGFTLYTKCFFIFETITIIKTTRHLLKAVEVFT